MEEKNTIKKNEKTAASTEAKITKPKKNIHIPEDTLIKVKSGFYGKLRYKNLITHERIVWSHQGEVQVMSMRELRSMKTSQPIFFKNQWIIIAGVADGEDCSATPFDIIKALAVTEYYKNFIDPSNFEVVCKWSDSEIVENISMMSPGIRENLIVAINEFIKDGRLDSIRRIKKFEKVLDCEFSYFE